MFETFIQNCCATLIDYDTITFGKFIDSGASGKVYKAKYNTGGNVENQKK